MNLSLHDSKFEFYFLILLKLLKLNDRNVAWGTVYYIQDPTRH